MHLNRSEGPEARHLARVFRRLFDGPARTPVEQANASRNAKAPVDRAVRWRGVRDVVWMMVEPVLARGARVAVVGAGNADDVPLARLAAVAMRVDLIDIDVVAARGAVRRLERGARRRVRALREDVTAGAADRIVAGRVRWGRWRHRSPRSATRRMTS
jgi:hypothetical protein